MTDIRSEVLKDDGLQQRLDREIAAHEATLQALNDIRRQVGRESDLRTRELELRCHRLEAGLRGAQVQVCAQDVNLRYLWVFSADPQAPLLKMLDQSDDEMPATAERDVVVALKRSVLETGKSGHCDLSYLQPQGRKLVRLQVDPSYANGSASANSAQIEGVICTIIDITHTRFLETEQRRLAQTLRDTLHRYQVALGASKVTIFTQDKDLRYTSITSPSFGRSVDEIVGLHDQDLLPPAHRDAIIGLKQETLRAGRSHRAEVQVRNDGENRCFELYIEPWRDLDGVIGGLTCAAVDVTEAKNGEAHLRMLMRELTHRSKNLLAVIQAMARQTAQRTGSTEAFLDQFGARLQAIAASHDLLIQESWHGAPLEELIRLQLGGHLQRQGAQISIKGPPVLLKPDAAQGLGLALHELTVNAARHGALSTIKGRVWVSWKRQSPTDGHGFEIVWRERGGPPVSPSPGRGFGTQIIERHLARVLDSSVTLTYAPEGVECTILVPVTQFVALG